MSENFPQDSSSYSPLDSWSDYLSPAIRLVGDFQVHLTGTSASVIHIKKHVVDAWAGNQGRDIFGEYNEKLELDIVHNVIVKYPNANKLWVFQTKKNQETITSSTTPEENLPIEMFLRFNGDYQTTPVALQTGDVIVDYFKDENSNVMPLYLQIVQIFGSFNTKNVVRKTANLAPYRGKFPKSINEKVQLYLANIRR